MKALSSSEMIGRFTPFIFFIDSSELTPTISIPPIFLASSKYLT